ncbi:MAG TPA: hypothetical protein VMW35_09330 [Myxococcota bacterium]|jgi:hypothetical protein|nr:hypothetical protein [Myxococcota bacterium]
MEVIVRRPAPVWLSLVGGVGLVVLAVCLAYALYIGAINIARIAV